jgi:sigma-B regulation protein RsbU (phosphoserine phosphatase)
MSDQTLLTMRCDAVPASLARVRAAVQSALQSLGCGAKCTTDVVMAVNEACMNIIQHAYGDGGGVIELEIGRRADEIEVTLKDFAPPVDVHRIKPRRLEDLRPGGLGTFFIRQSMDDCTYGTLRGDCGNFLRMRKRIG